MPLSALELGRARQASSHIAFTLKANETRYLKGGLRLSGGEPLHVLLHALEHTASDDGRGGGVALDLNLRQTPTASAAGSSSSSCCCARASEWWGGGMPCKRPRIDRGKDESACSGEGSRRRSGSGHEALRHCGAPSCRGRVRTGVSHVRCIVRSSRRGGIGRDVGGSV